MEIADSEAISVRGERHYVGVKNNWTEEDKCKLIAFAQKRCTYLVYGEEEAPTTGTKHLQMYMEFKNTISKDAIVKKLFPMWLGKRRGAPKVAAGYCKKGTDGDADWSVFFSRTEEEPGTWIGKEFGTISQQGKRTDIDAVAEDLMNKKTVREVAREHPAQYIKYHKGIQSLRSMVLEPRMLKEPPHVIVRYGPTQTGKTMTAHADMAGPFYKWEPDNGQWWDMYDGQEYVIIDEFRGQMPFGSLLTLLDMYGCRRPYKGGFTEIQAHTFVITSPVHPKFWYNEENLKGDESVNQLRRRITKIISHPMFVEVPWH